MVVADDSGLLREGLVRLLDEADCTVVAAVGDAPGFLAAVHEHRPDVAVVDVRMPPTMTDDGLRAAVEARGSQPDLGVLMLSAYIELSYADVLLSDGRGGAGYLLKDRVASLEVLVDALRTINSGGTVLDPEVVAQLLVARRRSDPLAALTPREREVLGLMAEGRSNAAIAAAHSWSAAVPSRSTSRTSSPRSTCPISARTTAGYSPYWSGSRPADRRTPLRLLRRQHQHGPRHDHIGIGEHRPVDREDLRPAVGGAELGGGDPGERVALLDHVDPGHHGGRLQLGVHRQDEHLADEDPVRVGMIARLSRKISRQRFPSPSSFCAILVSVSLALTV